jgi:hypothetical protein
MGEYKNLPCSKCGRNTRHKKIKSSNLTQEEELKFVMNRIVGKEQWKCLVCKTVETFDMKG